MGEGGQGVGQGDGPRGVESTADETCKAGNNNLGGNV